MPSAFRGVLKAKFKYLKQFNFKVFTDILLQLIPKISQFGSQALMVFLCDIVIATLFTEEQDQFLARVGLLFYFLSFNLFGFPMLTYILSSEAELSLNLLLKKYIRSKELLIKGIIWALVLQGVILIVAFAVGPTIAFFFIPDSVEEKSFFMLYAQEYITYSYLLPILYIPFHYCQAVLSIESNWVMKMILNLIHPVIAILTIIVLSVTVGDRCQLYWVPFFAELISGISGLVMLMRKLFEVM